MKKLFILMSVFLLASMGYIQSSPTAFGSDVKDINRNINTSNYLFWDFSVNYPPEAIWPEGWTTGFNYFATEGIDNSGCARSNLYTAVYLNNTHFQSASINMGSNPEFSLYMKLTYYNTPEKPIPADLALTYRMKISTDDGANWDVLKEVSPGQHVHNSDYVLLTADVIAYANQDCIVRFEVGTTPQTPADNLWFRIDNITIGTPPASAAANDLAAIVISGSNTPEENAVSQYKVTVENAGTATQNNYTVKLMQANQGGADTELGSTTVSQALASGETAEINVAWTPTATGNVTCYGQVVLAGDEDTTNDKTDELAVNVQASTPPGDYIFVDFESNILWPSNWTHGRLGSPVGGEGVDNSRCVRVNLYTMSGMETTFFQSNNIEMGSNPVFSLNMRITNRGTFPNEHALTPDTPITYSMSISDDNGATWNKLIEVLPGQHATGDDFVLFNPDVSAYANKSCRVRFDASTPMPATSYGTLNSYIRLDNITVGTPASTDFAATAISGDNNPKEGVESRYKITVQNKGANPQDVYTVKLMRSQNGGDVELASTTVSGQSLDPDETAEVNIAWTPANSGNATLYGQVVVPGDVNAINNKTSNLTVNVQRANDLSATRVDGNITPSVGISANYTVTINNAGHLTQDTYTVKLMQAVQGGQDVELASTSVSNGNLGAGQTSRIDFAWTPTAEGTINLYGIVELAGDSNTNNDKTSNLSVRVQPEGTLIVSVGSGSGTSQLPYNFQYSKSLSQSLYFPHEIGMIGGEISKIVYSARITSTGTLNDNIQNVPIQIWMGETDKENLSDEYVDPSTLTLVFDGRKSFPTGNYDVEIDLIEPYQYKGGNLVVYSFQNNTLYAAYNDLFVSTDYSNSARSRHYRSDNYPNVENPDSYGSHHIYHGIPNTRFHVASDNLNTLGSLSGVISDEDGVLSNVKIQIVGTQYSVTSDDLGSYSFPLMAAGEYNINVTKYGYNTVNKLVTISANANEILNLELSLRDSFTVAGNVKRFDTQAFVEGAVVTFNCEDTYIYTATTDENGAFSFMKDNSVVELYEGLYNITATADGLGDHNGVLNVDATISDHEIMLYEISYPVVNAQAEIVNNQSVVKWDLPEIPGGETSRVEGYAVYRFLEGSLESEWTMLDNNVTSLSYTDQAWESLNWGVYQYAVKAKYMGNQFSEAALTNKLEKDMFVSYTVNVSSNINNAPVGATVTLTNQDTKSGRVYSQKVTDSEVVFDNVWRGVYDLDITLDRIIRPYSFNDIEIKENGLSHTAVVNEIPYPVVDPIASVKDGDAIITWDLPKTYNEWLSWLLIDDIAGGMSPVGHVGEELTTAIRFTPKDLENSGVISGQYVTKVALGIARNIDTIERMEIRIWEGGTSVENPGELVYTHEITDIIGNDLYANYTWVDIVLDEPYAIDPSKELRIGWTVPDIDGRIVHGIGPKEDEEGPVWNNGKMTLWTSSSVMNYWRDASLMLGGQFRNCIKAFVSNDPNNVTSVSELGHNEKTIQQKDSFEGVDFAIVTDEIVENDATIERPVLVPNVSRANTNIEYIVYRLEEGDPETEWTLIANDVIEPAYTDTDWSDLTLGDYQYAIVANYAGELSDAVLSNVINQQQYTITLNVNPSIGGTVSGDGVYSSNEEVTVTAIANPNYEFVNWTENDNEVSDSESYSFRVNADRVLVANFIVSADAIDDVKTTQLKVYPNPTNAWVTIENADEMIQKISVLDISGMTIQVYDGIDKDKLEIDLSSYPTGVYFIKTGNKVSKVVKK